ncbi:N-acetyl-gamma-glutamyl-phosphate reductase ArgC [Gottschalkia acidurici 9a]|uniref:N-acetyl-gamma-glutamyl-phosphate reductase n=1 Tax=Gottschalkia acidurici (strain ATCC 7906 / DSM 604 / BCRC 14475 / CIP 104303 / KCTC 5404 / NCIMB 10678 / 9a) TaxID=1128398 RepID=K0B1N8_GOTA9|nr:N-acetyl-gamma-glutamyl-phosphate reductase [Gottschalkia acidurici]AFS78860.1 N-acetyl-gamma-glutamyl-phosphate reductase ArgC [Gottschalkia acidurici 9a]
MIKVGIIGATGYVGTELVRLLRSHKEVEIKYITSQSYIGQKYDSIYENFRDVFQIECSEQDLEKIAEEVDVMFIALPHGIASKEITASILEKCKVIDLGADYRLKNQDVYEEWYNTNHLSPELLEEAVYGLCEINREEIKKARLIANPGCYPTSSTLSLAPLLKEDLIEKDSIIIDAKSGVTGAGRSLNLGTHYTECNESIKAYGVASHRHTPEIEEQLSYLGEEEVYINFTPHLVPMNRGILTTSYAKLKEKLSYKDVKSIYEKYYKDEYFVRLTKEGILPETKWVKGSNFCDIGLKVDERTGRVIVIGAIDNMIKGAAGQAVQNMNILFNLDEKTGLDDVSIFPG